MARTKDDQSDLISNVKAEPMAHILLMNFDEQSTIELTNMLRSGHHSVHVSPAGTTLATATHETTGSPDLVILDLSQREEYARALVRDIVSHRIRGSLEPMLLCISRVYRGPRFELDLERQGARVVYV